MIFEPQTEKKKIIFSVLISNYKFIRCKIQKNPEAPFVHDGLKCIVVWNDVSKEYADTLRTTSFPRLCFEMVLRAHSRTGESNNSDIFDSYMRVLKSIKAKLDNSSGEAYVGSPEFKKFVLNLPIF